jgi:hypothetical protein
MAISICLFSDWAALPASKLENIPITYLMILHLAETQKEDEKFPSALGDCVVVYASALCSWSERRRVYHQNLLPPYRAVVRCLLSIILHGY